MRSPNRWSLILLACVLVVAGGCTNDSLDDGDGPDSALEIDVQESPPVTAEGAGPLCEFTVVEWTGTASNLALSTVAGTGPFNDIILQTVTIIYDWIDPGVTTPTRVIGLGDIAVPANGSVAFGFEPIAFDDLEAPLGTDAFTANLTLIFDALTGENEPIRIVTQKQLFVENCQ